MAVENECQVIATTHSYECIQGAAESVNIDTFGDIFAYVRLDKGKDGIKAKVYDFETLDYSIETGWEVR
ncbi:MAG: hypothetical protein FWG64_01255 [Firmicutes bacterium]|nr:hypothetical protein [Bacillota bacterium]